MITNKYSVTAFLGTPSNWINFMQKLALIFITLLCLIQPSFAVLLDKTIVIVNEEVITFNQLEQAFKSNQEQFSARGQYLPDTPAIRKQVLEKLILKSIMIQKVKQSRINITQRQVNTRIKRIALSNKLNLKQFRDAVIAQGISFEKYVYNLKQELAIQRLQSNEAEKKGQVSEQEINDALVASSDNIQLEYHAAHILLSLPEEASPTELKNQMNTANEIINKLNNGDDFIALAQQFSSGQNALEGGSLGWRKLNELPSLFATPVSNLKVGNYTQAIRSPVGLHIVTLLETRQENQVLVQQTKARHILIKTNALLEEADVVAQLESLRQRIIQGDDFETLAKSNSVDHVSASNGGDLGWVNKGDTVPNFERAMDELEVGQLSDVIKSRFGWHLIEVLDRRNIDDTKAVVRANVKNQIFKRKRQEVLELWQKRLRDEAYIKFI